MLNSLKGSFNSLIDDRTSEVEIIMNNEVQECIEMVKELIKICENESDPVRKKQYKKQLTEIYAAVS